MGIGQQTPAQSSAPPRHGRTSVSAGNGGAGNAATQANLPSPAPEHSSLLPTTGGVGARVGENTNENAVLQSSGGEITPQAWTNPGVEILGHLTQRSAQPQSSARTDEDNDCGAAALLAGRIMQGREATAAFLRQVSDRGGGQEPPDRVAARTELRAIADRVALPAPQPPLRFAELNQAQVLLYRIGRLLDPQAHNGATQSNTGMSDVGVASLAQSGGLHTTPLAAPQPVTGATGEMGSDLLATLLELGPGRSVVRQIRGRGESPGLNHFVTVGRRGDGSPYFYNSDPAFGDATCVTGTTPTGAAPFRGVRWDDPAGLLRAGITTELASELQALQQNNRENPGNRSAPPSRTLVQ